ncbi:PilA pilus assembly protein [Oxalicibacterium flavum]|uniref:PilA pilus assembly protein n=1 Tax=Oxalicibacterium flavum TaxID=179467 RepID=A0A8J2UJM8_9BURK|nr:Flp family type IVb pilin [Oxalicibacterium flavum]GGB97779.1 PilA pilus assembly protein [Oxalicibacterium flavum]
MKAQIVKFMKDEEGATAIEYGLIAGLVSIAIIAGLTLISPELSRIFNAIAAALAAAVAPT